MGLPNTWILPLQRPSRSSASSWSVTQESTNCPTMSFPDASNMVSSSGSIVHMLNPNHLSTEEVLQFITKSSPEGKPWDWSEIQPNTYPDWWSMVSLKWQKISPLVSALAKNLHMYNREASIKLWWCLFIFPIDKTFLTDRKIKWYLSNAKCFSQVPLFLITKMKIWLLKYEWMTRHWPYSTTTVGEAVIDNGDKGTMTSGDVQI